MDITLIHVLQEPPNLTDSGDAPDLPARPKTAAAATAAAAKSPPPSAPSPSANEVQQQALLLKQYEEQQAQFVAARETEERRRLETERQQQLEFEQKQREQAEAQRLAQEQLLRDQQMVYTNQQANRQFELEQELLNMRGQYNRDQILLEQYDGVRASLFIVQTGVDII